jgi:hypothetical protein
MATSAILCRESHPSKVTRFVATEAARGRYQGRGEVWIVVAKSIFTLANQRIQAQKERHF